MKQDVLCNENTVVKLLVQVFQDPHWEHFVKIRLRTHPGNTRYNRNGAGRGQREKTFYPVSSQLVKGWRGWQMPVCVCVYGLRRQCKCTRRFQEYSYIRAKTPAVPSFGSTAGPYTLFEGLHELYKDAFDIPRKKQLPQRSMKRAGSQGFTKLIRFPLKMWSKFLYLQILFPDMFLQKEEMPADFFSW